MTSREGFAGIDAFDDFFDGLVFDEDVANFDGAENLADQIGGGDFYAVEADAVGELVDLFEIEAFTRECGDARGLGAILQGELNLFGAKELFFQMAERTVVEHFAAVDDHDAATEFLDVVEVVGGEQDGGVEFAIDGAKELANVILRDDVKADRGLVEKKERRIVQQRGGQVAAHAFAERKLAHGRVKIITDVQDLVEALHARVEIALGDVVDATQQLEGFDDGDVPPELRALAEDDADGFHVLAALAEGDEAVDDDFAAGGNQDAGEHLDAGGFSGTVRADVAHHLATVDFEADAIDGGDGSIVADEKILNRAPDSFAAMERAEMFAEILDVNQRVGAHRIDDTNICRAPFGTTSKGKIAGTVPFAAAQREPALHKPARY